jgi:hypothetical protein
MCTPTNPTQPALPGAAPLAMARPRFPAWLHGAWPYLLLLALTCVFFFDSLFAGKVLYMRDAFCDVLPFRAFAADAFRSGSIPLWNAASGFGKPFAADPISGAFYPLHVLFCLFSLKWAFKLSYVLHCFIGGAGAYALTRRWNLSRAASLLTAVTFMFNTWMIAWMEFFMAFIAVVWSPWLLVFAQKLVEVELRAPPGTRLSARIADNFRNLAIFSLLFAIQYLSGYPEMVLYTLLLTLSFVCCRCLYSRNFRALAGCIAAFACSGLIILGLILPHLSLSVEFLHNSERAGSVDPHIESDSFHPGNVLTMIFPFIYGRPGYPQEFWAQSIFEFCFGTCYFGILPLMLVFLSTVFWRRRAKDGPEELRFVSIFFFACVLFGLLMSAGIYTPLYRWAYKLVPFFSHFRWPTKFLVYVMYGTAVLAGLGYEGVRRFRDRGGNNRRGKVYVSVWAVLSVVLAAMFLFSSSRASLFNFLTLGRYVPSPGHLTATTADYFRGLAFLAFGTLTLAAFFLNKLSRRTADVVVVAATFVNLFLVSREVQFAGADKLLDYRPETVTRLEGSPQSTVDSSYAPIQQYLYGSRDLAVWKWAKDAAVGATWLPYRVRLDWQGGMKQDRWGALHELIDSMPELQLNRLVGVLGLDYILTGPPFEDVLYANAPKTVTVAKRDSVLPRAHLVSSWEVSLKPNQSLQRLLSPEFDFRHKAIIDSSLEIAPRQKTQITTGAGEGRVDSIHDDWNEVSLEVTALRESLLVLNDTWYPGWKAMVNGVEQPIQRVNYLFRGVILDAGKHRVKFVYQPGRFRLALWITFATLIVTGMAAIWSWRRASKPADAAAAPHVRG